MAKCTWWISSPCCWNIVETPQDAHHSKNQVHIVHATSCHNLHSGKKNFNHSTQILLRSSTDKLSIRCGAANNTTCSYSSATSQKNCKFGYDSQRSMFSSWCADHFHNWNYICSLGICQPDKAGCANCCLELMSCFILLWFWIQFPTMTTSTHYVHLSNDNLLSKYIS